MNILLLGNGFDLNHKFPTSYLDFLHTIHFLVEHKDQTYSTVGDVFADARLQGNDKYIADAYSLHSKIYDQVELNQEELKQTLTLAENNMWFRYLYGSINKDIGWIDFEKEIINVLRAFDAFLNPDTDADTFRWGRDKVMFDLATHPENEQAKFIIEKFDFFYSADQSTNLGLPRVKLRFIDNAYFLEKPIGSRYYVINTEKIASELYDSLRDLSDILGAYLKWFVDLPTNRMQAQERMPSCKSYPTEGHVITFNYTNTFETLYNTSAPIEHIHGNVNSDIILGVNPDKSDELYDMDTTFLQFKKYFQRVFFGTDIKYIKKVKALQRTQKYEDGYTLYVIGHSLDITDKDIIMQLFEIATRVIILYHSQSAVKGYIKNLVEMYGKETFDEIRANKELQFLPQAAVEWKVP